MTRYFMKFTPLFAAEVQMMTPPRHQPRRSGRIRSSFRYSADDVRCKDCTRYDSGHPCHLNECVCLEERIEAGVVELIHSVQQQIEVCVPDLDERIRQQEDAQDRASQEQTM